MTTAGASGRSADRVDDVEVPSADEERFAGLYPDLRRFAAVVAPPGVDPDDLVQDALVGWLRRAPGRPVDDLRRYLYRSIANRASNERRSWLRGNRAHARHAPVAESALPEYPSDLGVLEALSPRERGALYLHAVDGHPYDTVGLLLGCSEAAARKASSRGRRRLNELMTTEEAP